MVEILVTGANGFVGSHICDALIDAGYAVRALVRETSDLANIENLNLRLVYGDLSDPGSLERAVEGVEGIIHNAGLTRTLDSRQFDIVNAGGTENLLRAIETIKPKIRKFIQISSAAASGPSNSPAPVDENKSPNPLTAYGRSKLNGEKAVLRYRHKFAVTILRPTAIYGPRDKEMLSFFKTIKFGIKPTFGTGECYANFTYVKDLAMAIIRTLDSDIVSGNIYFVAEKRYYSYSEAGDIISKALGVRAVDVHIPVWLLRTAGRINEAWAKRRGKASIFTYEKAVEISQKYWILDTARIEKEIGFKSPTSFEQGVTQTINWYRRQKWL